MKKNTIFFTSDSQLLAELGERLIATPQTALGELIKNAYDADATKVNIWLSDKGKTLNIKDDGNGMSEEEFRTAWMRIASSHKLDEETSRVYKRPLTGSKGVGRFAVRLLGDDLTLETSVDGDEGLRASFPWGQFSAGTGIDAQPITYWSKVENLEKGTWLRVSELRQSWSPDVLAAVSGDVLQLQAPFYITLKETKKRRASDPGFKVFFAPPGEERDVSDPTEEIFRCAAITLHIELRKQEIEFIYSFRSGRKPVTYQYTLSDENLIGSIEADIRFLPKRPGAFAGLEHHDGREAAAWVRRNGGIKVFDRGFRVPPYGSPDDDWIKLSEDVAARRRDWDSYITKELLPAPGKVPTEKFHPALHLPANHQVLGYVAVRTHNLSKFPEKVQPHYLQPAMDRQGFVNNAGFVQLYSIVRAGMELLAHLDLDEELRRKKEAREQAASELRQGISAAIREVTNNPDIPPKSRRSISAKLRTLAVRARRTEEAQEEAEVAVETLGLLGVIAAFMTHEMTTMLREIKLMLRALDRAKLDGLKSSDQEDFERAKATTRAAQEALERHIEYVQRFASNVRTPPAGRFKARAAIKEVVKQFEYFTAPRHIEVEVEVGPTLQAPRMPMSVYSGIVLNLYTNALKAVLAKKDGTERRIRVEASQEDDSHVIHVADSGIGVAPALREQIFEPLFSTTTDDGPLGPGMGMGLYIVRRVVKSFEGRIRLVEPPDGFATALEVRMPNA